MWMAKSRLRAFLFFIFNCGIFFSYGILLAQPGRTAQAVLTGVLTNAQTGSPVVGAKILVAGHLTYSVAGGYYILNIDTAGTFIVHITKAGFDAYASNPVPFQPGTTVTMPVPLFETLNSPVEPAVSLDTAQQLVHVTWGPPVGNYELIYDDGLQDNFTIWALQGNLNALRITPLAYPASVSGGSVNIGQPANYPAGSNPFVPFQIKLLDASGPGGSPGNLIAGPFEVVPANFGWVEFLFPAPVPITSGSFYMVMVQGGNAPNAAGLAVDESSTRLRSYSRFVTGGAQWLPAQGNFMIRAVMTGMGGPVSLTDLPEVFLNYKVWRLRQGEEQNPAIWTQLTTTENLAMTDSSWSSLPCGPYRWGIKAGYTGNRWSPAAFSNVLGKCWTVPMVLHLQFTCPATTPRGSFVQMENLAYHDTLYSAIADSSGYVTFPTVWKGYYQIFVKKFGYIDFYENHSADHADTVDLMILQKKAPPENLVVEETALSACWDVPGYKELLFNENWSGGNFFTQGWTLSGGQNWRISTSMGNPKPSAMFGWDPPVANYEQSLISRPIEGEYSPILTLSYDIFLDNFSSSVTDQLAVEVKYDGNWHTIKIWNNLGGNIPWTHDALDISQFSDKTIQIRFRSFGVDSYQINGWYIDNISILASESPGVLIPCIFGYNFYLDDVLIASVPDTTYTIPGEDVKYDSSYNACVVAIYASGYSEAACDSFSSRFLWPPNNVAGTIIGNNVLLNWQKPRMPDDSGNFVTPPGLIGYHIFKNDALLAYLPFPDSLSFSDPALEPGTYSYLVNARYDLTSYGFPGQQANSVFAGPALVEVSYGLPLPFYEPWDQGSFSYQGWSFSPGQGNWTLSVNEGNPAPSALFSGTPAETDYDYSLESPVLNASTLACAEIWLDFDLLLQDQLANGTEKLMTEIYYNGFWHRKATWKNRGSFGWTSVHVNISSARGKAFRIRFRTSGLNSENFQQWNVDNVEVYAVCLPPVNLQGTSAGNEIQLQWNPPQCNGGGIILNEGFENPEFPPANWMQVVHNTAATWSHTDYTSPEGVHTGNYSAGISWDYNPQDEWIIVRNVMVTGNLTFWSMAYQGSVNGDHYFVKVSTDNQVTWETLFDLSSLPPFSGGYNQWQMPYSVDLSAYIGETVDIAWHAWDGNGQGCWYYWAIDDCSVGGKMLQISMNPPLYDIYRQDPGASDFVVVNQVPESDTSYIDPGLPDGMYNYFVQVVNSACSLTIPSDTITVDVITSMDEPSKSRMNVFPNPAQNLVTLKSDRPVDHILMRNMLGITVLESNANGLFETNLRLERVPPGQYVLQVFTGKGTREFLISVVK